MINEDIDFAAHNVTTIGDFSGNSGNDGKDGNHDFQSIQFQRKSEWFGYLSLPENSKSKDEVFKWLKENTLKIENIIQKAYEEFKEKEYSEQEVTE